MANIPNFARPPFSEALNAWKAALSGRGFPAECVWIFDENLCFEKSSSSADGFQLGFQTDFTPPPTDAAQVAYDYFCEFEARLVFYRIGTHGGKSICVMLCDPWFEPKGQSDGFLRQNGWLISFFPGPEKEIEEVKDLQRWRNRILKDRPLHDLDFCMTLRSVHEILAHGRVLTAYEHYALKFLHAWSRFLHQRE